MAVNGKELGQFPSSKLFNLRILRLYLFGQKLRLQGRLGIYYFVVQSFRGDNVEKYR